jgi:hypothetical protein
LYLCLAQATVLCESETRADDGHVIVRAIACPGHEKPMSTPRQSASPNLKEETIKATATASTLALLRHFADLRDGTHGGARPRLDKECLFAAAVRLLDPYARQALEEINTSLLLGTGELTATGVGESADGGIDALWVLSWPEQSAAGIKPIVIRAYFGRGFLHPHLQGATVADWPLNVSDDEQAAAELPTLRAIASAEVHNLVFHLGGDIRVIPATVKGLDA